MMTKLLDKQPAPRRTRKTAVLLTAMAASAATLFAAAPAATAAPAGHAATSSSTAAQRAAKEASISFAYNYYLYARSALVEGFLYTDTCVRVYAATYAGPSRRLDYKSTSLKCVNSKVKLELEANIPGGADRILIEVRDAAGNLLDYWWEPS
ncbi:hypothetical protein [Amycolatopsis sp. DG1A-15b]|uniref:hypothetical protein n=1 Tax=Amycolatopsis sp. DG1A-15b TaxID=3052846 RepID=UPI00255BDD60|nr:hypothetical protein [Amycolatopsis sp. DG1A-15b]WIX92460.1 hypothetical protein QRY02_19280 [Amycolatopsis sp. DG1A-15b]